ncbi:MAG: hypothetical protein KDK70_38725, partial [Myxococcales bacterium]|nr:hypothetical protein [Myxococcales bacterium]
KKKVVSWLLGPLDAAAPQRLELGAPAVAMHVGPLDDQPGLDLATLGLDPPTRALWSWSGEGWVQATASAGPAALDVAGGDLDGDGWPDLLTAGPQGLAVHGGFAGPALGAAFVIVDEPASSIEVRHLDEDATPDLVLADPPRVVVRLASP